MGGNAATKSIAKAFGKKDDEKDDPKKEKVGVSILRGAGQGASLGFADELYGVLGATVNPGGSKKSWPDRYVESRDFARRRDEKSASDRPAAYIGGSILGAAPTVVLPGAGILNAGKGAKVAEIAGKGMLAGGVAGLGSSKKSILEEPGGVLEDVGEGSLLGGGLSVVPVVAIPAAKAAARGGKAAAQSAKGLLEAMEADPLGLQRGGYPGGKKALLEVVDKAGGTVGKKGESAAARAKPTKFVAEARSRPLLPSKMNKSELKATLAEIEQESVTADGDRQEALDAMRKAVRAELEDRETAKTAVAVIPEGVEKAPATAEAARARIEAGQKAEKVPYKGALQRETFEPLDPDKIPGKKNILEMPDGEKVTAVQGKHGVTVIDEQGRKYLDPDAGARRHFHKDSKGVFMPTLKKDANGLGRAIRKNPKTGEPFEDVFERKADHGAEKGYLTGENVRKYDVDAGEEGLVRIDGDSHPPSFSILVDSAEGEARAARGPRTRDVGAPDPETGARRKVGKGRGFLDEELGKTDRQRSVLKEKDRDAAGFADRDDSPVNEKLRDEVRAIVEVHGTKADLDRIDSQHVTNEMLERLTEGDDWKKQLAGSLEQGRMSEDDAGRLLGGKHGPTESLATRSKEEALQEIAELEGKANIAQGKDQLGRKPPNDAQKKYLSSYGVSAEDMRGLTGQKASALLSDLEKFGKPHEVRGFFEQGHGIGDLRRLLADGKPKSIEELKVLEKKLRFEKEKLARIDQRRKEQQAAPAKAKKGGDK